MGPFDTRPCLPPNFSVRSRCLSLGHNFIAQKAFLREHGVIPSAMHKVLTLPNVAVRLPNW